MIFKKEDDNGIFTSEGNEDKISFKLDEKDNSKIAYQNKTVQELKLKNEKYALFEIKTKGKNTVYLYCSDVESKETKGIFVCMDHKSISVVACDTENVKNMSCMFYNCSSLTELDLNNFDTTNVTRMDFMFSECSSLEKLDLKNFNTSKVTNMKYMFYMCSKLKNLEFSEKFNTINVTDMYCMFEWCSSLTELDLKNFNTTNVSNMGYMFSDCQNLKKLNLDSFNFKNVLYKEHMFSGCSSFSEEIQNNLNDVKGFIYYFKKNK